MARRRMFSLELVSSDKFLTLPNSAQAFYFHLNMHADDEGFVSAPRSLGMLCGGTESDLDYLDQAGFIIRFESGVVLIAHWLTNNTIRKDRSIDTMHRIEKAMVTVVDGVYVLAENAATEMTTNLATNFSANSAPQNRIEQNRLEKNRLEYSRSEYTSPEEACGENAAEAAITEDLDKDASTIMKEPTCGEVCLYCQEAGLTNIMGTQFWAHYYSQKWKDKDGRPIKDWKALARSWNDSAGNRIPGYG